MAGLAQRHKIIFVMRPAIRQRNNMMHLHRRRHPALAPTHLTYRMRRNEPTPYRRPRAIVPILTIRISSMAIVPGRDHFPMRIAVLPIRKRRASRIPARMHWLSRHSIQTPSLFLLIHHLQCTFQEYFQVQLRSNHSPFRSNLSPIFFHPV